MSESLHSTEEQHVPKRLPLSKMLEEDMDRLLDAKQHTSPDAVAAETKKGGWRDFACYANDLMKIAARYDLSPCNLNEQTIREQLAPHPGDRAEDMARYVHKIASMIVSTIRERQRDDFLERVIKMDPETRRNAGNLLKLASPPEKKPRN